MVDSPHGTVVRVEDGSGCGPASEPLSSRPGFSFLPGPGAGHRDHAFSASRLKSSATSAIIFLKRGSRPSAVAAKHLSR